MVPHALCDAPIGKASAPLHQGVAVAAHPSIRNTAIQSAECTKLTGKGLKVCSAVHARNVSLDGSECSESLCKSSCCHAAAVCQQGNLFSLKTEECIQTRMEHVMGKCCVVGRAKGSTVIYAGGAVGALIICSGLYFIVSMGSTMKVVKGQKPDEDEDSGDACKLYENKTPHMQVNQLIATDADDVFWED